MKVKNCWHHLFYADVINFFVTRKCQKIWKVDANIPEENVRIFWTTPGISMKFSGKMWFSMILKVAKNQGFTLFQDNRFLEKIIRGMSNLPPAAFLGLRLKHVIKSCCGKLWKENVFDYLYEQITFFVLIHRSRGTSMGNQSLTE